MGRPAVSIPQRRARVERRRVENHSNLAAVDVALLEHSLRSGDRHVDV